MIRSFPKIKPFRSKDLMAFVHRNMKPYSCCVCREKPWSQLHHFGADGAKGRKPSDHEIARVCLKCHMKYDFKRNALIKNGLEVVLIAFQEDALKIARAYMEHLDG